MTLKPFCSAKQAVAAIEALMAIVDEGVAPDAITKVVVRVPPPYARMIATKAEAGVARLDHRQRRLPDGACRFTPRAALRHRARRRDGGDGRARVRRQGRDRRRRSAARNSSRRHFPAEVEVTAGGQTHRKRVTAAYGDPGTRRSTTPRSQYKAERILGEASAADRSRSALPGSTASDGCKALADDDVERVHGMTPD